MSSLSSSHAQRILKFEKLKKQHGIDFRRRLSTPSKKEDIPRSLSGISLVSYNIDPSLSEVVEPVDFENLVVQQDGSGELRWLVNFPRDDLILVQEPRPFRTEQPNIPEDGVNESNPLVRDCLSCYTKDFLVVNRQYEGFSKCHLTQDPNRAFAPQDYEIDIESDSFEMEKPYRPIRHGSIHIESANQGDGANEGNARGSWANSVQDLWQTPSDPMLPGLLSQMNIEDRDRQNSLSRQLNRHESLFALYLQQEQEKLIELREPGLKPCEPLGHRLLVRCLQLRLDLEIEPIFASMALYDAASKKKISENFYFDLNSDGLLEMLTNSGSPQQADHRDVPTMARSCVFSITYPSPDIFIVIRLEKVLQQGDIGDVVDAYLKEDKNKEKLRGAVSWSCNHLGRYRMPLAWTAIDLMGSLVDAQQQDPGGGPVPPWGVAGREHSPNATLIRDSTSTIGSGGAASMLSAQFASLRKKNVEDFLRGRSSSAISESNKRNSFNSEDSERLLDNLRPVTLTVKSFFKQESDKLSDEDLFKYLSDLRRPSAMMKRLKSIPGCLELRVQQCPEEMRHLLTPEHLRVAPCMDPGARAALEVLEFPQKEVFAANSMYRNLLYVYPRGVNFSGKQGSSRNVAVRVQFMYTDGDRMKPLPLIFGKSNCPEFANEALTTVLYHNKSPDFYEEVKIQLPGQLQESHFLLFTFYHISCQSRKVETTTTESVLGYSWLPILRSGRLESGEYSLLIAQDRPSPSLAMIRPEPQEMSEKYCLDAVKWVDNHKELFRVCVSAVSTVHPQDPRVDRFLRVCHMTDTYRSSTLPHPIDAVGAVDSGGVHPGLPVGARSQTGVNLVGGMEGLAHDLDDAMRGLLQASLEPLIKFLTPVLDRLLSNIIAPPYFGEIGIKLEQTAFFVLAQLVSRITKELPDKNDVHSRNSLLTAYIEFAATIPQLMTEQAGYSGAVGNRFHRPHSMPNTRDYDSDLGNLYASASSADFVNAPSGNKHFHEELLLQWVISNGHHPESVMDNAWFFFELLIHGISDYLGNSGLLNAARNVRLSQQFVDDISSLVTMTTRYIVDRYVDNDYLVQNLNHAFAFFLSDLFSFMDRGFVMHQVKHYCRTITAKIAVLNDVGFLIHLKLDFLRIVSAHEHFVPLCLPLVRPLGPMGELTEAFKEAHFLVGLILAEVRLCLDTSNAAIQSKAVTLVWQLLSSHEADPRYMDPEVRSLVAQLYLPLVSVASDLLQALHDPQATTAGPLRSPIQSPVEPGHGGGGCLSEAIARDIAQAWLPASGADPLDPSGLTQDRKARRKMLDKETTRHLLLCLTWVLKNVSGQVLREWLVDLPQNRVSQLLELLLYTAANFEYKTWNSGLQKTQKQSLVENIRESTWDTESLYSLDVANLHRSYSYATLREASQGKKFAHQMSLQMTKRSAEAKARIEDSIFGGGNSARGEMIRRKSHQAGLDMTVDGGKRWRKDQLSTWRSDDGAERRGQEMVLSPVVEGNLSMEMTMVILDTLELIVQTFSQSDMLQSVLELALRVLLHCLSITQCTSALQNLLASQRALITKFPEFVFEEETEQCGDLCLHLLRHCSSSLTEVRSHAAASLYMLMRHNFDLGNNFARVKLQVTMALSTLVTQQEPGGGVGLQETHLRRSLRTILAYAQADVDLQGTSFTGQVQELIFTLYMILSDTVKMREFEEDPEMLVDLMYRIAKGYQNSPDLRLRWLQNMANKHSQKNQPAEAGLCLVHCAALVAEYLGMMEPLPYRPAGCAAFAEVSVNVLEESAVSDDVVSPDEEGVCCSGWFSEAGLVGLVEQAAGLLTQAGLYEVVAKLHGVLLPLHQAARDYKKLAVLHAKIQESYMAVIRNDGKRMFGSYFRVGFYGRNFGDLDGEEFIYKEPPLTKLAEIAHKLETFYGERFGTDKLVIIKDSNTVERDKLNHDKAYIQITYVEAYFEYYELRRRVTYFEKNFNIKTFMYATPFTLDGRAHGELSEQFKRKTILTTAKAFPYVKTRLSVVKRDQIILSPIEVAIEDLSKKVEELARALRQEPPDPKFLQMVLQGSIGTTVNQGPVEMAVVFLTDTSDGRLPASRFHNKLRLTFKDFIRRSHEALCKNRKLISDDQKEYQRELERNFNSIKDQLEPLLAPLSPKRTPKGTKSRKSTGSPSSSIS